MECRNSKINFMEKMTKEELAEAFNFNEPKIGSRYRHFKGEEYVVLDRIPDGENDGETTIVYKNVETGLRYTRSLSSWNSSPKTTRFEKLPTFMEKRQVGSTAYIEDMKDRLKNAGIDMAFGLAVMDLQSTKPSVSDVIEENLVAKETAFPDIPEFKTLKGDGFHLGDLKELNSTLEEQDSTASTCITVKNLKRDIKFQTYIRKEIISAKVLESSDIDGFGETISGVLIGYIYGPKQESGKVVEHSGVVNEDYLIRGEGYIKIMSKEKFEAKYKLEVPF